MRYEIKLEQHDKQKKQQVFYAVLLIVFSFLLTIAIVASPFVTHFNAQALFLLGCIPALILAYSSKVIGKYYWISKESARESQSSGEESIVGLPPQRNAFEQVFRELHLAGKSMIDRYLVGFDLVAGTPLWLHDEAICNHGCILSENKKDKTLWFESIILQQMARGGASGLTFIDARPHTDGSGGLESETLSHIIIMAVLTGRIEDLIVIDPSNPVHSYNFICTNQTADIKARKIFQASRSSSSSDSVHGQQDQVIADYIYRIVRALENLGLAWSIKDVAAALASFNLVSPELRRLLNEIGAKQNMAELVQSESNFLETKEDDGVESLAQCLQAVASGLSSVAESELAAGLGSDLQLTDAISRGKIIYFRSPPKTAEEGISPLPRLFRDDFEIAIKEINSTRNFNLEDPHLIFIDEDVSNITSNWTSLMDIASKGQFSFLFGGQSVNDLKHSDLGFRIWIGCDNDSSRDNIVKSFEPEKVEESSQDTTTTTEIEFVQELGLDEEFEEAEYSVEPVDSEEEVEDEKHLAKPGLNRDLAWFDFGGGQIVKGRPLFLNAEIPLGLNARELVTRFNSSDLEDIGIANWVRVQKERTEDR